MKNITITTSNKLMGLINNIAKNVAENSITSCGFLGVYEVEIPIELINQEK